MKKYYFLIVLALILGLVLTGCSLLSNVGQVPTTGQSGIAYLTKGVLASNNLVGLWHFDGDADDSSVYGNNGTVNGAGWVDGKFGKALSFNGNDCVVIPDSASLSITGELTIEAWANETSRGTYSKIVSRRSGTYFYFLGVANGKPYGGIGDGSTFTVTTQTVEMPLNEWHHLAFVYNETDDKMYLYYDGELKETVTVIQSLPAQTGVDLSIGADREGTANFFTGLIDEVRIWDVALTADQISQSYEALHVDDDWAQWPGAYKTITKALAVAGDDDTIIVHRGIYAENVVVNKSVTLLGANYDIDPAGITTDRGDGESVIVGQVTIKADDVTVNGFKLTSSYIAAGYTSALNVNISYNILVNVYAEWGAIHLSGGTNQCDGAYVGYNTIINAQGDGIWTVGNDDVTIEYNHILDNTGDRAIEALNHVGTGIVIHGNTITNSGGKGINYWAEDGGVITGNVITNSKYEAIYTDVQATINGNQILGGDMYGILVMPWTGGTAAGSTVSGNIISNTNWEGIQSDVPVIITNNDISGGYNGIQLSNAASDTVIDGNNIHDNRFWGLSIQPSVTEVIVVNNQFANNPYCGVMVWGADAGSGIHVNFNEISGNGIYGVESKRKVSNVDATCNWWGADNGPGVVGPGDGDKVSANVDYNPWLGVDDTPVITSIIIDPLLLAAQDTETKLTAAFNGPTGGTAIIDWGDGDSTEGTVSMSNETGTVTDSHIYTDAGVYTVTLTIANCYNDDTMEYQYVVVYDPSDGFVTGGGWIYSPAGAYISDSTAEGKASFGFVSKYKKGQTKPTGNTEFQFKAGNLNFHSDDYDWLVITGGEKAMYKGTGNINDAGNYGFMLTAIDSDPDMFRIKIWDKGTDNLIYDNQKSDGDDADPTTEIAGGQIVIHKK